MVWLKSLLNEVGISLSTAPIIWSDNLSATYMTANPIFHSRTKHMEIDFHFVRDLVKNKHLFVRYIGTDHQIADVLTKPLPKSRFQFFRDKLYLAAPPVQLAGA